MNNNSLIQMRANSKWNSALMNMISLVFAKSNFKKINMIEVGSYQGESAELFCNTGLVSSIWCIDPWQTGYDEHDIASASDMSAVQMAFDSRMAKHPQMHKFVGTLDSFVESTQFKDISQPIDLIYIDGLHTYDGCKHDIQLAKSKVKPHIAYAGHDFHQNWPGVKQAVLDEFGQPDAIFLDTSWIVFA